MRIAWLGIGVVLLVTSACGSSSSGSSGGSGGSGAAGAGGGAGSGGSTGGPTQSGQSASCVAGGQDPSTMISEALASFSIGSAFSSGNIVLLNAQNITCDDTNRQPCLGVITCNFDTSGPPPTGTYNASDATSNPGGIPVLCSVGVNFADCSKSAFGEAKAGSTVTLTTVDNGHFAGSASLDFGSGTFSGNFDAPKYPCTTPTPCTP